MTHYAENTSVSVERSRAEIETTLARYGATHFGYISAPKRAAIEFIAQNRRIRFVVPLPARDEKRFWQTPGRNKRRTEQQAYTLWEQACRQRWRALNLAIKAKLEAVVSGISEFDAEFLAFIVEPGTGRTVAEIMQPQLAKAYEHGGGQLLLTSEV